MDIVVPYEKQSTGMLATTAEEFSERIHEVLSMSQSQRHDIQVRSLCGFRQVMVVFRRAHVQT